ncbi:hypothetical protein [Saccharopolyspora griseoalba]|uniref:Uncharacterized protein n=1 Tax=Saccharopolyspora griseoalba TaxID=1431848 RepID=A0ABW2LL47_9PSEU
MTNDHVKADPDSLRQMSNKLRAGTSGLEGPAKSAPEMPEVTISNQNVGHTISEITKTAAALAAGVEDIARKIDASDGSYAEVDNRNAEDLYGVPKFPR